MKRLLFIAMFASTPALAEEKFEVRLSPRLGYSNYSGFRLGAELDFLYKLTPKWQALVGGSLVDSFRHQDQIWKVHAGAQYNFGDDFSRAVYLAGGVGLSNEWFVLMSDSYYDRQQYMYGWAEVGKRFRLNDSGTFTWSPAITAAANEHGATFSYKPLQFSWSF